tara:strand:+ start:172 stop:435 length:264 start_codon:yes stop_codon:yes gene_type:complete
MFSWGDRECGIYRKNGMPHPVYGRVDVGEVVGTISLSSYDSAIEIMENYLKVVSRQVENPNYFKMKGELENTVEFVEGLLEHLREDG